MAEKKGNSSGSDWRNGQSIANRLFMFKHI